MGKNLWKTQKTCLAEVKDPGEVHHCRGEAGPAYSGPVDHGEEFRVYSKGRGKTLSDVV